MTAVTGDAQRARTPAYVYFVITVAAIGGVLFGYDTGIAGGAAVFVADEYGLSGFMEGMVVSAVLVGAFVGALGCGPLSDRFGRRPVIAASGVFFAVGALVSALAPGTAMLLAARGVLGLGMGAVSVLSPVYIAELAPPRIRGMLVAMFQLLITLGILLAYGVNALVAESQNWRLSLGLGVVPGLVLAVGVLFVPESPRWLVNTGREAVARTVLGRLRGGRDEGPGVEEEVADIRRASAEEADESSWRELFTPAVRPMVVVGGLMAFFAQACGITAVIYFAPQILENSGFGTSASLVATFGLGVVNVLLTLVGMALVDRIGRRPLLLAGVVGLVVSLAALAVNSSLPAGPATAWIAFGCLAVYIVAYAASPGMLAFVIIAEIFPLAVRGKATSFSLGVNYLANLLVAMTFLPMLDALGAAGSYWLFTVVCVGFLAFTHFLVPETKGRTLEQIEAELRTP